MRFESVASILRSFPGIGISAGTLLALAWFAFSSRSHIEGNVAAEKWEVTLSLQNHDLAGDGINRPMPASPMFEQSWKETKQVLCPDMKPNIELSHALFALARDELGLKPKEEFTNIAKTLEKDAFRFNDGGFGHTSTGSDAPMVYLRIYKAANNQINSWGKNILQKENGTWLYSHHGHPEDFLENIPRNSSKSACIITAIRDPIERYMSGYNEIEWRIESRGSEGNLTNLSFPRYKVGSKNRFRHFVQDYTESKLPGEKGIELGHIFPMSGILHALDEQSLKLTNYLPSLANLSYAWPKFVSSTCSSSVPPGATSAPMPTAGQHQTSNDPLKTYRASKEVWHEQGDIARALCVLNAMDYACFDNMPGGIPPICQDAFSGQSFLESFQRGKLN